jgi:NTE family protein
MTAAERFYRIAKFSPHSGHNYRTYQLPTNLCWCTAMQYDRRFAEIAAVAKGTLRRLGLGRGRRLALALQGGGALGAFTWGVLDRLLEADAFVIAAASGASAGALNALVLADGLAEGGARAARLRLERLWRRLSLATPLSPFGSLGPDVAGTVANAVLALPATVFSPYQLNPLGLDPLRRILADELDFARLAVAPVALHIAATRVRNGRPRLFRNGEITLEVALASCCLPLLHHAVAIDEEWYWDGGFSANPPLRPLLLDGPAEEVLIVQLAPQEGQPSPRFVPDIARRLRQIALNAPLQKEEELLADLAALCRRHGFFRPRRCRRLRRVRLHRIAAPAACETLPGASPLNLDWRFLTELRDHGRTAAERWLATLRR